MSQRAQSILIRYAIAITSVVLALVITRIIGLKEHFPSVIFLAAVTTSAWYGGLGPGLLATVLSALALDAYFIEPLGLFSLTPASWIWLAAYAGVAILISLSQAHAAAAYRSATLAKSPQERVHSGASRMKCAISCRRCRPRSKFSSSAARSINMRRTPAKPLSARSAT